MLGDPYVVPLRTERSMFMIKDGYRENPGPAYFLDDVTATRGIVFQPDVYRRAEDIAVEFGVERIVDVGCGWADKLAALHERRPGWDLTGIDFGANIDHCRDVYPDWGTWVSLDLESGAAIPGAAGAVVVCSDVIEHLANPMPMLLSIFDSGCAAALISTPERDEAFGSDHMGPPENLCHVREWNTAELAALLESVGFVILEHGLTRSCDINDDLKTQLAVVTP